MQHLPSQKRLILVSNRLPFRLLEKNNKISLKESSGGLVSALKSYFEREVAQQAFTEKIWVGSADFPEQRWHKYTRGTHKENAFSIEPIFVDTKVYNKYYNGFCNATLWPLFHYFPSFVEYDDESFRCYEEVNKTFAEKLLALIKPGDIIWVHDYQLFLLPGMIREKAPDVTIGFFLHIPFPTYEVFRLLHKPWKEKIIRNLLGADLIGFHTYEYVQHFLKTVRMLMGYDHEYRTVRMENRLVKADLFPLGIDYRKFHKATEQKEVIEIRRSIFDSFHEKKIIFSVDRLDYTKGVTHRLSGFERFLELHPEWREKVVFILAVVPSREIISKYNERRKLIEEQVGRLNGKYSTLQWQPVIYRYSNVPFDELCALYQAAHVALITPLRDGMNLVAKEYIASRVANEGVLILSELAGAANELGEAILVNPTDKKELAQAIHNALSMPFEQQKRHNEVMQKRLADYDVVHWVKDFLQQLNDVKEQQSMQRTKCLNPETINKIVADYRKAEDRHLLLDYDGTLVPFARLPEEAQPDRELLALLETLASDEKTSLTLISGRDHNVLEKWFGELPVNLIAEHGASVKLHGRPWRHEKNADGSWKPLIRPTLELFSQRCPGSFVEEKNHTIAWHYRNVEPEMGFTRSRELLDNLYHLIRNAHLQVIDGNKVIEVRVAGVDKGTAALNLIHEIKPGFILAFGDDKTDEDMFRAVREYAVTIKVGAGNTFANYSLPAQKDVIRFLKQLAGFKKVVTSDY